MTLLRTCVYPRPMFLPDISYYAPSWWYNPSPVCPSYVHGSLWCPVTLLSHRLASAWRYWNSNALSQHFSFSKQYFHIHILTHDYLKSNDYSKSFHWELAEILKSLECPGTRTCDLDSLLSMFFMAGRVWCARFTKLSAPVDVTSQVTRELG